MPALDHYSSFIPKIATILKSALQTSLHVFQHYRVCSFTAKSLQSCPTLCDPMDCSLPGSSVHEIFQARVLEWGAIQYNTDETHPDVAYNSSFIHFIAEHHSLYKYTMIYLSMSPLMDNLGLLQTIQL